MYLILEPDIAGALLSSARYSTDKESEMLNVMESLIL